MTQFGARDSIGRQQEDFSLLFRLAPIGLALLDQDLRFVRCNDLLAEINGISAQAHIGRTVREIVPSIAAEVEAPFREAITSGRARHGLIVSGTTPSAPGLTRTWVEGITPLPDETGVARHILVSVQEVTELEEAKQALRETERILHASQELSPDAFTVLKAIRGADEQVVDFEWEYANPAAQRILGVGPLVGRRLLDRLPGNADHELLFPRYVRLLTQAEPDEVELEYTRDGLTGWFRNSAVRIDADRIAVAFRDISARKRAERELLLTNREFRHRVKNVLAVMSGLVSQTARSNTDVPAFASQLLDRLASLSAVQDLLTVHDSGLVDLDAVVRAALKPFATSALDHCGGPPVSIASQAVTPLALALNELATNALKYGGLSSPEGKVRISWSQQQDQVTLEWRELGGPRPSREVRQGFGSSLIRAAGRWLPQGRASATMEPEGLHVEISFTCHRRSTGP